MTTAIEFLREHGHTALVSLGCGAFLNRIDNHVRLLLAMNLTHYVGVDREPSITAKADGLFNDPTSMESVLTSHRCRLEHVLANMRVFPGTWVEELAGVHCAVIVCQRVLPFVHWEQLILSMNPALVLQEDLHGCERQDLRHPSYQRSRAAIRTFGLQPFRPWWIFPGEFNMILWQRREGSVQSRRGVNPGQGRRKRLLQILRRSS